jgi:hypothetical protein
MDNKRSQRRSEIRLRCPCRTLDGVPIEIELLDLSERGCLARAIGFELQFGQALRLFPEGCEAFTATVRRTIDDLCGIEFDRELPTPVFERMRCYAPQPEEQDRSASAGQAGDPVLEDPVGQAEPAYSVRKTPQPYGSLLTVARKTPAKKAAVL